MSSKLKNNTAELLECIELAESLPDAGVSGDGIPYEGDYVITPSIGEKTMATKNKVMKDNVTILAIPFYNVSNQSGGTTAYIGSEV